MMGSPIVFQTAPPHPASKARITCSPQLVGGAEASQKGFGEKIFPANLTEISGSGFCSGMGFLQKLGDGLGGALAVSNGVNDFPAAVHAISTRKVFGIRSLSGRAVHNHAPVINLHSSATLQEFEQRRLPDCRDDHVARDFVL